ncbi:MAG: hypothetical protein BIFFINMI_02259 [Phycisphaerae bacterium]|nr:hypothetical protein [Phycisphaerae bacterium]
MPMPVSRRIGLLRMLPQLVAMAAVGFGLSRLGLFRLVFVNYVLGVFLVLTYRYVVLNTVTRHHMLGIRRARAGDYGQAADRFVRSLEFFSRFPVLDTWRSLLFLSPERYGYRELALTNLGLCYLHMERFAEAERCLADCVKLHPGNLLARAALEMVRMRLELADPAAGEGREE